jgi:hypothetical protein
MKQSPASHLCRQSQESFNVTDGPLDDGGRRTEDDSLRGLYARWARLPAAVSA